MTPSDEKPRECVVEFSLATMELEVVSSPSKWIANEKVKMVEYQAYQSLVDQCNELKILLEAARSESVQERVISELKGANQDLLINAFNNVKTVDDLKARLEIAENTLKKFAETKEGFAMDGWFIDEAREALEKIK